jgi:hypothetical protein
MTEGYFKALFSTRLQVVSVHLLQKLNLDIEWIQPPFGEAAMASHGTLFLAHAPTLLT